jgi:2-hydroxy-3-keto-5-methylthiopentenyl-1-phosphate phosphatase
MNLSPAANSDAQGLLVTDFDGTITRFDFYDLVSREYPEIAQTLTNPTWELA